MGLKLSHLLMELVDDLLVPDAFLDESVDCLRAGLEAVLVRGELLVPQVV